MVGVIDQYVQVLEASDGKLNEPWPAQLNKLMVEGGHDLVLSIGQVVPHEVLVRRVGVWVGGGCVGLRVFGGWGIVSGRSLRTVV